MHFEILLLSINDNVEIFITTILRFMTFRNS